MKLLTDLLERRVARYFVAYCAAGWAGLEVVDLLIENDVLPPWMWSTAFALFVTGLPGAVIVSWFHGARGRQEVPVFEKILLANVALAAVVVTGLSVRSGLAAGSDRRAAELAPWDDPARVAVLYFDERGGDDASFLAQGLTEELISKLSGIDGLTVVSSSGSKLYRGRDVPSDSIGRGLQVGTLVQGSVAMASDRVRVQVSLVRSADGRQYETTTLERPRAEIFDLQDELVDSVSVFLRSGVGRELGSARLRAGTTSVEAWELVQQAAVAEEDGMALFAAEDHAGAERVLDRSDSLLAAAAVRDPAWGDPPTRRGWLAYRRSRLSGLNLDAYDRWTRVGLEHAARALELDPSNAAALDLRGTLSYWRYLLGLFEGHDEADRLFHAAEADFEAAIAADRYRATALTSMSHLLLAKGERAQAKLYAERAYQADPFLESANLTLWRQFLASWDLALENEARRPCEEGQRRFAADFRFEQCRLMMMGLPTATPDLADAWSTFERFVEKSPPQVREVNRSRGFVYVSMALVRADLPDSARAVALRSRTTGEIDPVQEVALLESVVRTWLGDESEAVSLLSQYLAANPGVDDGFRQSLLENSLPWYQRALAQNARLRSLLGLS